MSQSAMGRRWNPSSQRKPRGKNGLDGMLVKSSEGPSRFAVPRARASAVSSQNPSFSSSNSAAYDLSTFESPKKYPMPPIRLENKDCENTSYFLLLNGAFGEKVCENLVGKRLGHCFDLSFQFVRYSSLVTSRETRIRCLQVTGSPADTEEKRTSNC